MKKQLDNKKMMTVDDPMDAVCKAAVFLASDQSIGITGECINGITRIVFMIMISGFWCFTCITLCYLLTKEKIL